MVTDTPPPGQRLTLTLALIGRVTPTLHAFTGDELDVAVCGKKVRVRTHVEVVAAASRLHDSPASCRACQRELAGEPAPSDLVVTEQ